MGDLLLVTGDSSADEYAAELVENLRHKGYGGEIYAAAGRQTGAAGARLVENLVDHAVVGFFEIVTSLPYYFSLASDLEDLVQEEDIAAAVFLDFPGFNLRMAGRLRKFDLPLFYYIPPQVWAWGKSRLDKLEDWFEELFVIFPFEDEFYRENGVGAEFVGHPKYMSWKREETVDVGKELEIAPRKNVLAFFPGSRSGELTRHLDVMSRAAARLVDRFENWEVVFSVAPTVDPERVRTAADGFKLWPGDSHSLLDAAEFTVLTSGTVTMEAAFSSTPMVVCYRTSWASYLLGRMLVDVDRAAMPNHFSLDVEVPELIQSDFNVDQLVEETSRYLADSNLRQRQRQGLKGVNQHYRGRDPAGRVAERLLSVPGLGEQ